MVTAARIRETTIPMPKNGRTASETSHVKIEGIIPILSEAVLKKNSNRVRANSRNAAITYTVLSYYSIS